jgi:hypothetical protein
VNSDPDLDAVTDPVSFYFLFLWAGVGVPRSQLNSDPEEKKRRRENPVNLLDIYFSYIKLFPLISFYFSLINSLFSFGVSQTIQ